MTAIDEAIELKQGYETLFISEHNLNNLAINMKQSKYETTLQSQKLIDLENKFDKALDLMFKKDIKLKDNVKKLYKTAGKTDYSKLSKTMEELINNPKKFKLKPAKVEPILKALQSQGIIKDIDSSLELKNKYSKQYIDKRKDMSKEINSLLKTSDKHNLLKEFTSFMQEKDKSNSVSMQNYHKSLKDIQRFKNNSPEAFSNYLKEKKLDKTISQEHKIISTMSIHKHKNVKIKKSR